MIIDIVEGREAEGAATMRSLLERLPIDTGVAQQLLRNVLPVPYVLVEETRDHWHRIDLGPSMVRSREIAAAFVAAREHDDLGPIGAMAWPDPGFVAVSLPLPWATEFAIHGVRAQRYEAQHLATWMCEHWGRNTRDSIAAFVDDERLGSAARELLARTPAPPDHPVEIAMIGEMRLLINGTESADPNWRRERVRALLAWLVLHPTTGRPHLAATLWPDLPPERAAKNLRTTLNYLHGVLEPQRSGGDAPWYVRADGSQVTLHASLDVDLWRFTKLLDRADLAERAGKPSDALPLLLDAVGCWRGDLIADLDLDWLDLERIHVRGRYVRAACRAGELLVATGRGAEAVEVVRPAIEVDPWHFRGYEALAAGYRAIGDVTSARAIEARAEAQRQALDDDELSDLRRPR
jgi:DNA-binding SARP family transcriptional activator